MPVMGASTSHLAIFNGDDTKCFFVRVMIVGDAYGSSGRRQPPLLRLLVDLENVRQHREHGLLPVTRYRLPVHIVCSLGKDGFLQLILQNCKNIIDHNLPHNIIRHERSSSSCENETRALGPLDKPHPTFCIAIFRTKLFVIRTQSKYRHHFATSKSTTTQFRRRL